VRVDGRRRHVVRLDHGLGLAVKLLDRALAGARDRLVARHDEALDAGAVEDRLEGDDRLHRGAVGVGHDSAVLLERLGVDLGDHERHVVVHAPLGGVVHDHRPGVGEAGGPVLAGGGSGAEEREVEALDCLFRQGNHGEVDIAGRSSARTRRVLAIRDRLPC
jgi:hypothetical protein